MIVTQPTDSTANAVGLFNSIYVQQVRYENVNEHWNVGLGLIGGSLAKAIKKNTDYTVWNLIYLNQ